ncbi:alpha/beta hydrolase [Frigidibacter oleivorans]|uniref:alpha/beta hydrolase n=1 Tax=Frigidibacter oleivorans TaxID=2487129 RepID=UPI000F8E7AC9|nr:alpha/beta hydrolase fold domain-containing protein [Frigidibacter oleivorans]
MAAAGGAQDPDDAVGPRPPSLRLRLLNLWLRRAVRPLADRPVDPALARRMMERAARTGGLRVPEARAEPWGDPAPGPGGLRLTAGPVEDGAAILHFHGGAYVAGSPRTHAAMLARLSRLARLPVVAPRYRLAPEHPFPAALEDACAAWDRLRRDYPAGRIALGGDSAGGGLALLLAARLLARGEAPGTVYALSPWTDLAGSGASIRENAGRDALLSARRLPEVAALVLGPGGDPVAASPLHSRFGGLRCLHLQVGETEILLDDSLRLARRLGAEGVAVDLHLHPHAPHVVHLFDGWVPEARQGLRLLARAIRRDLGLCEVSPAPPRSAGS